MPANFNLTLDTDGPDVATLDLDFNGVDYRAIATTLDADATQIKVWGDVDGVPTEADAVWQAFVSGAPVVFTPSAGEGVKTVNVRLRDDVWNLGAAAVDTLTVDTTAPVVTITVDPDRTKISKVAGRNTSTFTWIASEDIVAYEVMVVPAGGSPHGAGALIPEAGGSVNMSGGPVAADTPVESVINGADYDAVVDDGTFIVKVFGQDAAGNWSL